MGIRSYLLYIDDTIECGECNCVVRAPVRVRGGGGVVISANKAEFGVDVKGLPYVV